MKTYVLKTVAMYQKMAGEGSRVLVAFSQVLGWGLLKTYWIRASGSDSWLACDCRYTAIASGLNVYTGGIFVRYIVGGTKIVLATWKWSLSVISASNVQKEVLNRCFAQNRAAAACGFGRCAKPQGKKLTVEFHVVPKSYHFCVRQPLLLRVLV